MSHCHYHALSSVRKWGGVPEDYIELHQWFDQSKAIVADPRHRALRHHAEGIFMLETIFGVTITNADGKDVPVRSDRRTACPRGSWAHSLIRRLGAAHPHRTLDAARTSARRQRCTHAACSKLAP